MKGLALLTGVLLLCGCKSSSGPLNPKLGEEFSIKVGQQVTLQDGGATLSVQSVEDSRCPIDMRCVIAGRAKVSCTLSGASFALSFYQAAVDTSLSGYDVRLTSVEPWPTAQRSPAQEDYILKFIVTKL